MLSRHRADMPGQDVSKRFDEWKNACLWLSRGAGICILQAMVIHLILAPNDEYALVAGAIVRPQQHSAGPREKKMRAT